MSDIPATATGPNLPETDDPLIKALPPASDYVTYLTILEYQLTPERLPTLHRLLQDPQLTTNIGWDLVQLLLPMLPASQECLQDVARLGNPREVILRVSDALMKLDPANDDDVDLGDYDLEAEEEGDGIKEAQSDDDGSETAEAPKQTSLHVLQFNCLLDMLLILHSRIKTKFPSRFVAASIQAILEAYTAHPLVEITDSLQGFLRSMSPSKRPMLPPRSKSDRALTSSSVSEGVSAPDPEAEEDHAVSCSVQEGILKRLLQFALIEVLKTYMLHCTGGDPPGMQWALRLQEKLGSATTPTSLSKIREFGDAEFLIERDRSIGKIVALSKDIGISKQELLAIALTKAKDQPAPLDFEELPQTAEDIPLERHGCLLLLAARFASSVLFDNSEEKEKDTAIAVYPDLCTIISNFLGQHNTTYGTIIEEPIALTDSILTLALAAHSQAPLAGPPEEERFRELICNLTACVRGPSFRANSRLEKIPSSIFHSNPDAAARFRLVHDIFQQQVLEYARESAIKWFKEELVAASKGVESLSLSDNPFTNATSFSTLYPLIYHPTPISIEDLRGEPASSATAFLKFIEKYAPLSLAALNLYIFLLHSEKLRDRFDLANNFNSRLRENYLAPLRELVAAICEDEDLARGIRDGMGGGEELVLAAQGAAAMVGHTIDDVERLLGSASSQG